jgi:hypothetical protein
VASIALTELRGALRTRFALISTWQSGEYAVFCGIYRARSSRRNSREVTVSKAASPHSTTAKTARVMMEGTDTATRMSTQHRIVTTSLGTLTLPSSRSLKALCPRR